MVASDSIDFAKTTDKLKSQEHNATAQSIEKLLAEAVAEAMRSSRRQAGSQTTRSSSATDDG